VNQRLTVAAKNDHIRVLLSVDAGMNQSEKLPGTMAVVLEQAALAPVDLDYTALNRGPGSWTALRLGFVALKALHLAAGVPVYAVPTLLAHSHPFCAWPGAVVPALDAKRGRFYAAVYRRGVECAPPQDATPEEIARILDSGESILTVGPDAELLAERLSDVRTGLDLRVVNSALLAPESLFILAEDMIAAGALPLADWDGPDYIRSSDAEAGN
jgi:tRNA threonylcarbamoyladenosine biosynthesis protein TsaB